MKELQKSLLVTVITTVVALLCAEGALRYLSGKRVFALTRYRAANIVINKFPKNVMSYDSLLGWRLNPGVALPAPEERELPVKIPEFHTIDYGVRRNSAANDHPRQGGVLVSGASFTAGSEVNDEDAWPARLETLIDQPVVNGAVGGFGADQIVLRAEEMLPVIKPKVLIVDLVPDNIEAAGYSYHGFPKPYFTVEKGQLALQNVPVPLHQAPNDTFEPLKDVLSYSLVIDRTMATYFPDAWYSSRTENFTRANNDEVNVSCLLLRRLKKETDAAGVRLLVTIQYGGGAITSTSRPDGSVRLVEDCLRRVGIQLVDEFASLKALWQNQPDVFKSLYINEPDGVLGHKSRAGNLEVAKMVAAALALPAPANIAPESAVEQNGSEQAASGEVLLRADDTSLQSSPYVEIEALGAPSAARTYRIVAAGKPGEHYLVVPVPGGGGTLTFSVDVRADTSSNLKLQLFRGYADGTHDGVMGIFDLGRVTAATWRLGVGTNIEAGIQPIDSHWHKLWITGTLPPSEDGHNTIIIQIADGLGKYSFVADGDAVKIRNVTVERSGAPSHHQVNAAGPKVQ